MRHLRNEHACQRGILASAVARFVRHTLRWAVAGAMTLAFVLATFGAGTGQLYADEGSDTTTVDMTTAYEAQVETTAEDGSEATISVRADVPEGAFESEVELQAKLIANDDADAVEDELDAAAVSYDGFIPLDIFFADVDGNEVEPAEPVTVSIELPASMLGDDADASTIAVSHLIEGENGTVSAVETVADAGDETEGTVLLDGATSLSADTEVSGSSTITAEFTVDSFSSFTITWSGGRWGTTDYFTVTVHYVDEDGNEIDGVKTDDITISDAESYTFSEIAASIGGYSYSGAIYNDDTVTRMEFTEERLLWNTRTLTFYDGDAEVGKLTYGNQTQTADVYLVYQQADLYITDTIATNGQFNAVLGQNISGDATVEYTWYRSSTGEGGTWEEVERERVTVMQDNLSEDGMSVNVALDSIAAEASDSDRYWYYVTATVTTANGDESTYASDAVQVPYYVALQNGSFESPECTNWNNQLPNGTDELVWQTTGVGTGSYVGHDIELASVATPEWRSRVQDNYNIGEAAKGNQFAELNCEAYGALYQDVMTVPGARLYWNLAHAARQETDTMALVIMPVDMAEDLTEQLENISNSSLSNDAKAIAIREAIDEYQGQDGVYIEYITDGVGSWKYYSGSYEVGGDQYLTRFFFVAVSTGSGKATVGNLLDDVSFSSTPMAPTPEQGQLTVTKTVNGYVPSDDYSVTITVQDENDTEVESYTFPASAFTRAPDGSYRASYAFKFDDMEAYSDETYTVSEEVSNSPEGYTESSTVAVGEGESISGTSVSGVTVTAGAAQTVAFTNTYTSTGVDLQIFKYWDVDESGNYSKDDSALPGATFTLYKDAAPNDGNFDDAVDTDSVGSYETDSKGLIPFYKVTAGTYWLVETAAPSGYSLADPVKVVVSNDGSVTIWRPTYDEGDLSYSGTGEAVTEADGVYRIAIGDTKLPTLPQTGGAATPAMFVAGAAMVAVSGWALARARRKAQ